MAVDNGEAALAGPSDELLQELVDALDEDEQRLERLGRGPKITERVEWSETVRHTFVSMKSSYRVNR